jgi:hypothetical protein
VCGDAIRHVVCGDAVGMLLSVEDAVRYVIVIVCLRCFVVSDGDVRHILSDGDAF